MEEKSMLDKTDGLWNVLNDQGKDFDDTITKLAKLEVKDMQEFINREMIEEMEEQGYDEGHLTVLYNCCKLGLLVDDKRADREFSSVMIKSFIENEDKYLFDLDIDKKKFHDFLRIKGEQTIFGETYSNLSIETKPSFSVYFEDENDLEVTKKLVENITSIIEELNREKPIQMMYLEKLLDYLVATKIYINIDNELDLDETQVPKYLDVIDDFERTLLYGEFYYSLKTAIFKNAIHSNMSDQELLERMAVLSYYESQTCQNNHLLEKKSMIYLLKNVTDNQLIPLREFGFIDALVEAYSRNLD